MPRVSALLKKPVVEGCMSIDVRVWHRDGLLRPFQTFCCSWSHCGKPAGSIEVVPARDAVVLLFRWRGSANEEWKPVSERVPLTRTACHLGGTRVWFGCPGPAD